jgi:hypothetical protein
VLAAEVCYRIALDINEHLRESLGAEGLVYMAAHHALLSDNRIPANGRRFPESLINVVLTERYPAPKAGGYAAMKAGDGGFVSGYARDISPRHHGDLSIDSHSGRYLNHNSAPDEALASTAIVVRC